MFSPCMWAICVINRYFNNAFILIIYNSSLRRVSGKGVFPIIIMCQLYIVAYINCGVLYVLITFGKHYRKRRLVGEQNLSRLDASRV